MHKGSCLCGTITYEISGEIGDGYFCHCKRCRKAGGSLFAANARIKPEQFNVITGLASLKSYHHPGTGLTRKFCAQCGSAIVSERMEPALLAVRLGTLDTPLDKTPIAHIFVDSKAEWETIADTLPQYAERPVN